jgi:hypothetical protein
MFGSPVCREQVKGRCNSYCYSGDFACDGPDGGAFGRGGTEGAAKGKAGAKAPSDSKAGAPQPDTSPNDCAALARVTPTGLAVKVKSGMPHMAYNTDGFYVRAAACFIAERFKAGPSIGPVV